MAEQVSSLKTGIKYKNTPIGKIPVDWEVAKLKRIATGFYNGGTPDTTNKDYWNGGIPWITGADFEDQKVKTIRRYITSDGVKNSATNVVPKGNLLIVTRTGVGKVAIAPFDIAISQDITGVILDSQKASLEFIYWYIDFISTKLKSTIQGTSISGLLRGDLEEIDLPLPAIAEQKKIAEILTTFVEAIDKTTQIIEKTKEVKKGLMQKLLTRGIGHKKFKKTEIGEIPEEWSLLTLEEIVPKARGSIKRGPFGGAIKKEFFVPEGYKVYEQKNVIYNDFELGDYYIDEDKFEELKDFQISQDDLLISCSGTIGRIVLVPRNVKKGIINQALLRITLDKEKMMPEFFKHLFETDSMQKKVISHTHGSAMKNIVSMTELKKIQLVVPSIEEQNKIVELINGVDSKVEDEQAYKSELGQLKKGLMQVLLTGKIRVSV